MTSGFLGFGVAFPDHSFDNTESREALRRLWPRLRQVGGAEPGPGLRHTVEPLEKVIAAHGLGDAMKLFAQHAPALAESAARGALRASGTQPEEIDVVISVSCTGYLVPSLGAHLVRRLGLRPDVVRLPLTELGCSGGSAAVAAAHRHLVGYPQARVLVVAVELPSLSFQPGDRSLDNLTASMVFGDGAVASVMGDGGDLSVAAAASHLIEDTSELLGFELRDGGFHVVLDRRLPGRIERSLGPLVARFRSRQGLDRLDFVVVHAGGPRILQAVNRALGFEADELAISQRAFEKAGNMSSASILFGLSELAGGLEGPAGDGLAIAFGPGVTVELTHLRWRPRQNTPGKKRERPENASE